MVAKYKGYRSKIDGSTAKKVDRLLICLQESNKPELELARKVSSIIHDIKHWDVLRADLNLRKVALDDIEYLRQLWILLATQS
jgi:hypothetical protein